jgi:hypothetical protein
MGATTPSTAYCWILIASWDASLVGEGFWLDMEQLPTTSEKEMFRAVAATASHKNAQLAAKRIPHLCIFR